MSVDEPNEPQLSPPSGACSTVRVLPARPDSVADWDSAKSVAETDTLVPLVRYVVALLPLTLRAPPVGPVVSRRAVSVGPGPVVPLLLVALTWPLCVVAEPVKV